MRLTTLPLFLVPTLIWGSTFFAIKFQLGVVSPSWSVSYRFILAGAILLTFCGVMRKNLTFSLKAHLRMLQQGTLLFGINYWLVYIAEQEIISALVAIAFSTIIFMNILFGRIFLKKQVEKKVFVGATFGIIGTVVLFRQELMQIDFDHLPWFHLGLCFSSVVVASLGNITSAINQKNKLPVIQTNAYGMLYGGIITGLVALISQEPITFDDSFTYIASLLYLAVFGSIFAFGSYLTLIGKIGADKAAYVLVVLPLIAVLLSILFEGYEFGWQVLLGIALILGGNVMILKK